ncbi:MAG: ComEC/Rec2 family competence protein [Nibricoccus sp.]
MESPFNKIPPASERHEERHRSLRHRAPVLWILIPFIGGLLAAHIAPGSIRPIWAFSGALVMLSGASCVFRRTPLWAGLFCLSVFLAGAGYYNLRQPRIGAWDTLPPREVRLQVRVQRTFTPSTDGKRISGLGRIIKTESIFEELLGQQIYFSLAKTSSDADLVRSAEIEVRGVLQPLSHDAPSNTFDGYLVNAGMNFRLNRGRILAQSASPTRYRQFCAKTQARLASFLSVGLEKHPDLTAISRAMLLGLQQELSEQQNQCFMNSGTMHLFSISGLHIAVIALALEGLMSLLRFPRVLRFIFSALLLWLYVDITGTAPSAVRAYGMVILLQASFVLRLPVNPLATLAFAALVSLAVDPMQLFSASFQMSYGIVAALLLLGLPLSEIWCDRWQLFRSLPKATWTWWHRSLVWAHRGLLGVFAIGLSTALVSTIAGIIYFNLFTPGSLIANIVLIPLGSLVIASGFVSMLCGMAGLVWLGATFNHASALILLLCEQGITYFLKIRGVFWSAKFSNLHFGYAALAILMATLLWGYSFRWSRRCGGIWPPFIVVAAAVALGVQFS